ncbi:MAG: metal-dependent hydrolase [Bacteroidia bacterium]|nr:metal-dependent hydrolase [Bacteroidia bacterium]
MKFTYFGHSCFLLELAGKSVLVDPFIRNNPLAAAVNADRLSPDYILVSHGHQDHTDDLVEIAKRSNAKVICSWEIMVWLQKQGVTNVHSMNVGGKVTTELGLVQMTFAAHSSSLADGTYAGVASGFLISTPTLRLYYSGDTALTTDLKLIGELTPPDWAILPLGGNFTMDADDALIASNFIQCNKIIGVHFNTFPPIQISEEETLTKFQAKGKTLVLPAIQQQIELN